MLVNIRYVVILCIDNFLAAPPQNLLFRDSDQALYSLSAWVSEILVFNCLKQKSVKQIRNWSGWIRNWGVVMLEAKKLRIVPILKTT